MKIAFTTTVSFNSSSMIGRVIPLAHELSTKHEIHILYMDESQTKSVDPTFKSHSIGVLPFTRTPNGKIRLQGWRLMTRLLTAALHTTQVLFRVSPEVVVIVKSQPHNVLGASLWHLFNPRAKIILDVDDFELTANVLTSLSQRAVFHWAERRATSLADHITAATPFLADHFSQLDDRKKVTLIPTSIQAAWHSPLIPSDQPQLLYVGSLSRTSGHRIDLLLPILKAVKAIVPTVRLTIAGTGDDEKYLQEECKKENLSNAVTFTGRFVPNTLKPHLTTNTVMLDPVDTSITERAKSSFRVALAAALGMPVVTSNVGIRPYLLPASLHTKYFAAPANVAEYAKKIVALLNETPTASVRAELRQHAGRHSWVTLAKKYDDILRHE